MMNELIDDLIEEAIMALRLAGAVIPRYNILEDGSVYFDFRRQEELDTSVHNNESGDHIS
jgi:hypothetical protein